MKIINRELVEEDYTDLKAAMIEAYQGIGGEYWRKDKIDSLLGKFPDGQICVEVDGKVVAVALSIIIKYDKFGDEHTYAEVTGDYTFKTHDPKGDVLYGIEVFVHPEYRDLRLGRRLYDARKELCERLNLRSIVAGGRIPNYNTYAHEMTPKEYIDKVKRRELYDPTLTFQLANDFHVRKVLNGYLPGDTESKDYATLLEWNNIYFQPGKKRTNPSDSIIRIGVVQWQMRLLRM